MKFKSGIQHNLRPFLFILKYEISNPKQPCVCFLILNEISGSKMCMLVLYSYSNLIVVADFRQSKLKRTLSPFFSLRTFCYKKYCKENNPDFLNVSAPDSITNLNLRNKDTLSFTAR